MKKLGGLILMGLLLVMALPLAAQSELTAEEEALLTELQAAYAQTQGLETLQANVETNLSQDINAGGQAILQTIAQSSIIVAQTDGDGNMLQMSSEMDQTVVSEMAGSPMEITMTMDMLFLEGDFYVQFRNLSAELTGFLPEGWITPDELQNTGFNFGSMSNLSGWESLSMYPLTTDYVIGIKELPSDEIGGQEMRVFNVILEPLTMMEATGLSEMLDPAALGADTEAFMADFLAGSSYSQIIWVGVADNLIYRTETSVLTNAKDLEVQGMSMDMKQDSLTTVNFFAFNEPVTIEIPKDLP